uniref:Multifunctional methyltransferase subunit TRM112-like protein n=1 Tax=Peromyscus maniculatus bairdii TaxID=230844 RepID=A0A8C8U4S0_PERMB
MTPKVEWVALVQAADTLNLEEVSKEPNEGYEHDETFLRKIHHVLLEVDVLEGTLQCPESGCLFPISCGIPNML